MPFSEILVTTIILIAKIYQMYIWVFRSGVTGLHVTQSIELYIELVLSVAVNFTLSKLLLISLACFPGYKGWAALSLGKEGQRTNVGNKNSLQQNRNGYLKNINTDLGCTNLKSKGRNTIPGVHGPDATSTRNSFKELHLFLGSHRGPFGCHTSLVQGVPDGYYMQIPCSKSHFALWI